MNFVFIKLFGQFDVSQNGVSFHFSDFQQLFISYLILHPHTEHSRDKIADMFWQNTTSLQARKRLNTLIWRLRKKLAHYGIETPLFHSDSNYIVYNQEFPCSIDVHIFEKKMFLLIKKPISEITSQDVALIENKICEYSDSLLSNHYEDWVIFERERLRLAYIDLLIHLMNYYIEQGNTEKGIAYAQTILKLDPLREEIQCTLMSQLKKKGDRIGAINQYNAYKILLEKELGIEPFEETTQLFLQISSDSCSKPHNKKQRFYAAPNEHEKTLASLQNVLESIESLRTEIEELHAKYLFLAYQNHKITHTHQHHSINHQTPNA